MSSLPGSILLDLGAILALTFEKDELHPNADRLMREVEEKGVGVFVSDLTPYEAESHFLSGKSEHPKGGWNALLLRLWQDPLFPRVPVTSELYAEHLNYYRVTGGRFSYFDSYHAATSRVTGIPLVTSDGDLLSEPSISTMDLGSF